MVRVCEALEHCWFPWASWGDPQLRCPLWASFLTGPWVRTHACACMRAVVSDSLLPYGLQPTRLLCLWDYPGKSTRVDCCILFQEIFPTRGSNLRLLHWQVDSLPLCHLGSPGVTWKVYNTMSLWVKFMPLCSFKLLCDCMTAEQNSLLITTA